jgi:hypothetical protein
MAEFVEKGNSRKKETYVSVEDGVAGEPPPGLWGGRPATLTGLGTSAGHPLNLHFFFPLKTKSFWGQFFNFYFIFFEMTF